MFTNEYLVGFLLDTSVELVELVEWWNMLDRAELKRFWGPRVPVLAGVFRQSSDVDLPPKPRFRVAAA